jgi:hypothetical protein
VAKGGAGWKAFETDRANHKLVSAGILLELERAKQIFSSGASKQRHCQVVGAYDLAAKFTVAIENSLDQWCVRHLREYTTNANGFARKSLGENTPMRNFLARSGFWDVIFQLT